VSVLSLLCCAPYARAQGADVRPIDWSKVATGPAVKPGDDFGQKLAKHLQLHSRYVLAEIDRDYQGADDLPEFPGVEYYYPFGRHEATEHCVRPLGDLALGIAVMLKTGIYSPETAKVSRAEAVRRVELAIRGIAITHRAHRKQGRNWGGRGTDSKRWQAAYWASLAAEAAWMLWNEMSADTQRMVTDMTVFEADSFITYQVPYRWRLDGKDLSPGNTRSEENAWNARLLAIAQAMMPDHANVVRWREKASELQVSAFARPSDTTNDMLVDGKPVREWINGWNMSEDGVLVNHRMIQPDYTADDSELRGSTVAVASLARQRVPESTFLNAKIVYRGLTELSFKPGPSPYGPGEILAPGGTIYMRQGQGKETVYLAKVFYPQGADWVRDDIPIVACPHLNMDIYAEIFDFDAGKDFDAMGWAHARVDRLLEMQARSGEAGNVYQPGDWTAEYYSTEQVIFEANAEAWLLWWLDQHNAIAQTAAGWGSLQAAGPDLRNHTRPIEDIGDPEPDRVRFWETVLQTEPAGVGPSIDDRKTWNAIGERPEYRGLVGEAEQLAKRRLPPLTDELFLEFSRIGRREGCESRIDERQHIFTTLVYAECIENKGRFLPAIERAIVDFDQQKTWLFPAHDPELDNFHGNQTDINICSSAMAWNIATAAAWLGDKLSPETRRLVADNLERRIFTPFEEMVKAGQPRRRWILNTANHNSVTMAGVIGCAMAQIDSPKRRAYFAAAGEKFTRNYLYGFTADGYCAEGIGYWSYGFGRFVMFAETLRRATDGKVDLLSGDHVRAIAEFGHRTEIQSGIYPTYSDCSIDERPDAELVGFLGNRYGWSLHASERAALKSVRRGPRENLFDFGLFDTVEVPSESTAKVEESALPPRDYFPNGGLLICRPATRGEDRETLAVAVKGGHNAEPHNHNDAGSYILVLGDQPLVVDPGAEVYTSRTFSPRRYKSDVLNSFGHSVPRVAGRLQSSGFSSRANILSADFSEQRDVLRLDLAPAYDVDEVRHLTRTFKYDRNETCELEVEDSVAFTKPQQFETAIITLAPFREQSHGRLIVGKDESSVAVDISADGSDFRVSATTIEEELAGGLTPTRIAIELTEPVSAAKIRVRFRQSDAASQVGSPGR
jgi:hypothetical protein